MDALQQRIMEIAQQIPEYVGYQAKERRRDSDRLVRRQLAAKYDKQRTRLARISRQSPLEYVVNLENLDQKLLRLIARLNTAPGGYAGWFDAGQIVEGDLDQLTQFDSALAEGVAQLQAALDRVAGAVKSKTGVDDAIAACAEELDTLNSQFDQREQFLSMGKKPSLSMPQAKPPVSPLQALAHKAPPREQIVSLANLKLNDAVSYETTDYIVSGKITFTISGGTFWALLLQDREQKRWLRVGPGDRIAVCQEIKLIAPSPFPKTLDYGQESYSLGESGTANASVEGSGGVRKGTVTYAQFTTDSGKQVWIEDYGTETRAMQGHTVDANDLTVYRR